MKKGLISFIKWYLIKTTGISERNIYRYWNSNQHLLYLLHTDNWEATLMIYDFWKQNEDKMLIH